MDDKAINLVNEQVVLAAKNTIKANIAEFLFVQLFGKKAVFVQGERRFKARRFNDKNYLTDRRLRLN